MRINNCFVITSSQPTLFILQNKRDAGSKIDKKLGLIYQTQADRFSESQGIMEKIF